MPFEFKARFIGSPRDSDKVPRWYRPNVLGDVIQRDGRAVFIPNARHPALRGLPEVILGVADNSDDAMMQEAERVFREALAVKKSWRAERKQARANRMAERAEKAA